MHVNSNIEILFVECLESVGSFYLSTLISRDWLEEGNESYHKAHDKVIAWLFSFVNDISRVQVQCSILSLLSICDD
jgi:hypothetical protein